MKATSGEVFPVSRPGVIFDANGWILTNHHVVQGSDSLTVDLKDGRSFKGTVYGTVYQKR